MRWKILVFVLGILVLVSACTVPGFSGGGSSVSGGSGIFVKFIDAPNNGETFVDGDTFSVVLSVENGIPGKNGLTGNICLRDGTTDTYGGIPSNNCRTISLRPADVTSTSIVPTQGEYRFPESGFYSYHSIDNLLTLDNQIYADFNYDLETIAVGNICVSRPRSNSKSIPAGCGDKQNVILNQPSGIPLTVTVSVDKSRVSDNEIRLRFDITLRNSKQGQILSSGSFLSGQSEILPEIGFEGFVNQMPISCTSIGSGRLEFRQDQNEKVIKCTSSIILDQDYVQVPFTLRLRYGYLETVLGPKIKLIGQDGV